MMRLPARLSLKLANARIARVFDAAPGPSLIHCVDPAEVLHPGSVAPVSHEKMQGLMEIPAPVIWVGGSEPLAHPGIAHFVRALAQSSHFVFLETDGTLLRRRIHEFQPLPQLFMTVRLDDLQTPASVLAVEGLCGAHLSGFCTVVHSLVQKDSDLGQLSAVRSLVMERDMDGWLITAVPREEGAARKVPDARLQIPSWFWRRFSERVEEARHTTATVAEGQPLTEECEEGARVA